jgi:Zn-dependent protease
MDIQVPIIVLVLLFSVIVHECAHGLAAEYFGDPTARQLGRLTLNPLPHIDPVGTILVPLVLILLKSGMLFGWAKPVPVNGANLRDPARDYPKVAAAGPVSNLLLATISAVLLGLVVGLAGYPGQQGSIRGLGGGIHTFMFLVFQYGVMYNVLLALFNLIPIPPLDGSWIVMRFLRGSALRTYASLRPYGFLLLLLLLSTGLRHVLFGGVLTVANVFFGISDGIIGLLR